MKAPAAYAWKRAYFCYWCGIRVHYARRGHRNFVNDDTQATRDHLQPRSAGGVGSLDNVVVACKRCNNERGARTDWIPFHKRKRGSERGTVEMGER